MSRRFALRKRGRYPWLFAGLATAAASAIVTLLPAPRSYELLIPAMAAVAGFVYFIYSQHLQETRLFSELFKQFNERYDRLNGRLNEIASRDSEGMLSLAEKQVLYDYFNLCAEEYLYYKAGFIDEEVWKAWARGMKAYLASESVRRLWEEELSGGSYYGFTLDLMARE